MLTIAINIILLLGSLVVPLSAAKSSRKKPEPIQIKITRVETDRTFSDYAIDENGELVLFNRETNI